MSIFHQLYQLNLTGRFGFATSANKEQGTLTVIVSPVVGKGDKSHPSTREQFSITGTPDELDEHFVPAITKYESERLTITAVLEQQALRMDKAVQRAATPPAKPATNKAPATKPRQTAPANPVKPTMGAPAPSPGADDEQDGEQEDALDGGAGSPLPPAPPVKEPATQATLF